jgi:hypothetical protein
MMKLRKSIGYEIRFNFDYERNINFTEFDGMFLHKEEFGKTYGYDTEGNVTSVENLAAMQSHATYDAYNNMLTYRQPNRLPTVKYTLDYGSTAAEQMKHLLLQSTSPLSIVDVNTYDSAGNPLTRQTQNTPGSPFIKDSTAYTANQNYTATQTDARGKVVASDIDLTAGTLTSVTDPNGQSVGYTSFGTVLFVHHLGRFYLC